MFLDTGIQNFYLQLIIDYCSLLVKNMKYINKTNYVHKCIRTFMKFSL